MRRTARGCRGCSTCTACSRATWRAGHLSALAWASYFTGVVFPGTQALFSSFDLLFRAERRHRGDIVADGHHRHDG